MLDIDKEFGKYRPETSTLNQQLLTGFLLGGGRGEHSPPPLGSWLPPLERPTSHILIHNYINFDIVHVESFPLLMAKAVLNECFALLNFRAPRRRKQSLSLSVLFFLLFLFQYICTGTLHHRVGRLYK